MPLSWRAPGGPASAAIVKLARQSGPVLRILNVGDFNWQSGRERDTANLDLFPIRDKLSRAAVRAGHLVVEFSDRAVARARAPLGLRRLGRRASNAAFLATVTEAQPALILLHFADEIDNETLERARRLAPGVRIADINIDPLPSPRTRARLLARRGQVDATFVTTAGEALAEFGSAQNFVAFMPNPVDAAVETGRAFATPDPAVDLVFPVGDDSPRQVGDTMLRPTELLAELRGHAPSLRLDSPGANGRRLRGRAYFAVLERARMGLSLSRFNDQPLYASDRMAHMLGSGLLTFVDARLGFQALFGEDAPPLYEGPDDLARRIAAFAGDDLRLRAMAERSWRRTFALFEAGRVFAYLLDQIDGAGAAQGYEWPTTKWRS